MINLSREIKRNKSVLKAKAKAGGMFFTLQNLTTSEWFWVTFKSWEDYQPFKAELARLIYDKPGSFLGMPEVVFVTWKEATAQKHQKVNMRIWRTPGEKNWFSLLILDGTKTIFSIDLRRPELINLMDSITGLLSP